MTWQNPQRPQPIIIAPLAPNRGVDASKRMCIYVHIVFVYTHTRIQLHTCMYIYIYMHRYAIVQGATQNSIRLAPRWNMLNNCSKDSGKGTKKVRRRGALAPRHRPSDKVLNRNLRGCQEGSLLGPWCMWGPSFARVQKRGPFFDNPPAGTEPSRAPAKAPRFAEAPSEDNFSMSRSEQSCGRGLPHARHL